MDLGPLRALALDLNFSAHGVPATVTRPAPDDIPIDTRVIWVTPITQDAPFSGAFAKQEPRRIAALRKDEVPTVPIRTAIVAPEKAGDVERGWRVDGIEREEADHVRVTVILDDSVEISS